MSNPATEVTEAASTATQEAAPAVEIVEPAALVAPGVSSMTFGEVTREQGLVDQIAHMERAVELFEMRSKLIESCRLAAIKATSPSDWVLFKDRGGVATAMLCNSGANIAAQYYGIDVYNLRPIRDGIFRPLEEKDQETGEIRYSCWFDARSNVTGQQVKDIEAGRSSSEQFIGRAAIDTTSGMVKAADLRAACYTLARTKACRILGAMVRLSTGVLELAWQGTTKKVEDCRKGSGYGTSGARGAAAATDQDIGALQAELRDCLLALTDNKASDAQKLLKEITEYNSRSCENVTQLTNPGRFYHTWKRLAMSSFGKQAEEWVKLLGDKASKQAVDGARDGGKERK